MSTVNPSAGSDSAYAQYAFPTASKSKTDGMGQADFLRLMTEQMKNQDPLNPLKGNEFLGQLAQFSTVQGIENMQQAMSAMASVMENDQSLRAASLVGRDALVEVDKVKLAEGAGANGEIVATHSGPVQLEVVGAGGQVVRRISVEAAGGNFRKSRPGRLRQRGRSAILDRSCHDDRGKIARRSNTRDHHAVPHPHPRVGYPISHDVHAVRVVDQHKGGRRLGIQHHHPADFHRAAFPCLVSKQMANR